MSGCSKECGGGIATGWRFCNKPTQSYGGKECLKSDGSRGTIESTRQLCNTKKCPIHGKWSPWKPYTVCTRRCGGGKQERKRVCGSPSPQYGGSQCPLPDSNGNEGTKRGTIELHTRPCNTMKCDSTFWKEIELITGQRPIRRSSKVLDEALKMRKEYRIDFMVLIEHTSSLHDNNVLQFIKDDRNAAKSKEAGSNFLGVWFNGAVMIVRALVNEETVVYESDPVELNKWTKVSILQIKEHGSYTFTITVNGRREFAMINKKVRVVEGVSLWVSNLKEEEQSGSVRWLSYFHP